jgi:hypothetical protein
MYIQPETTFFGIKIGPLFPPHTLGSEIVNGCEEIAL